MSVTRQFLVFEKDRSALIGGTRGRRRPAVTIPERMRRGESGDEPRSRETSRRRSTLDENGACGQTALSMGRSSEYPSDDFIGICIKAVAMAEQNSLRLP